MSVSPAGPAASVDINELIASDRVHGSLYYDPSELQRPMTPPVSDFAPACQKWGHEL